MTNKTNFIADTFNWIRQVIESAETPFAMTAILILPILAPAVPATVTGMRLHSELDWPVAMAVTTAIVLELLGYASAIFLIKSISKKFRNEGSFLSILTSGIAYLFYISLMYTINVQLGQLSGESLVENRIFALLSFLTIPTGLLAAESINNRSEKEEKEKLRLERRADSMERLRIRQEGSRNVPNNGGNLLESSNGNGNSLEGSKKVPDWRKVRPTLSRVDLENLASLSPDQIRQYAQETGFTYKTISNWRLHAREELNLH